jgi:hypothetical protein
MSFYCEKHVGKGRKTKWCCKCGKTIDKGESSYSIPGENFEVNHDMCIPCHDDCEKNNITEISQVLHDSDDE